MRRRKRDHSVTEPAVEEGERPKYSLATDPVEADEVRSVHFTLEELGWKSFQDLCLTIAERKYGLAVNSFSFGRDEGRDGSAIVTASTAAIGSPWGQVAIQCKHSSRATRAQPSIINPELPKIDALVRVGHCDTYILYTNRLLSAATERKVKETLRPLGVKQALVIGGEELDRVLTDDKELRGLVPRVYGLGDISEIVDERVYSQTRAILSAADIDRFVTTSAYFKTLGALEQFPFCVLLGEPASGKTAIMRAVAIAAADRWQSEALWLTSLSETRQHWNAERNDQLILIDDAFGPTSFDPESAEIWNRCLPLVDGAIRRGTRFLLTSRDYVYAAARPYLKQENLPVCRDGEVAIKVEALSIAERRQIVYNHLRLGNQPVEFKTAVKPYLNRLTSGPSFLPEVARRLGDSRFTAEVNPTDPRTLFQFVLNPREYLQSVIRGLAHKLQGTLVLLMSIGSPLTLPLDSATTESPILQYFGLTRTALGAALREMNGSLVQKFQVAAIEHWQLRHPTVEEAIAAWMLERTELLDLYIGSAPLSVLVRQVCCGVSYRGAVDVPKRLWSALATRLMAPEVNLTRTIRFFAYRCSRAALQEMGAGPWIVDAVDGRGFLSPLENDPALRLMLRFEAWDMVDADRLISWLRAVVKVGAVALDPYPITNPVFAELCTKVQAAADDLEWPSVVEDYVMTARNRLEKLVRTIVASDRLEVDRPDAVAGIIATCQVLLDWIDDGDLVIRIQKQISIMRAWAGDSWTGGGDALRSFVQVSFGVAPESDIFMDVDAG